MKLSSLTYDILRTAHFCLRERIPEVLAGRLPVSVPSMATEFGSSSRHLGWRVRGRAFVQDAAVIDLVIDGARETTPELRGYSNLTDGVLEGCEDLEHAELCNLSLEDTQQRYYRFQNR